MFVYEHYYCNDITRIISIKQVLFSEGGNKMIKYDRLWETMKEKDITQYDLYTRYNVNRAQLDRLRKNQNVQTNTIDRLCNILHCRVEDIMEHFDDDNLF